ncbi:MAG: DUF4056 domain-containing protein [Planctomycetota bacterium]
MLQKILLQKIISLAAGIGLAIVANGCQSPRPRVGCLPTSTPGIRFLNPDELGPHSYSYSKVLFEKNGIVYTCKAGHIDITHVRWAADYTRYFVIRTHKTLMKGDDGFSFSLPIELSKYKVRFVYPKDWKDLPRTSRERIANEISYSVGPYLAYSALTWHEILTWFGVHFVGVEPEFNSAFSWEDSFSNLLGTELAVRALQDDRHSYDKAMTLAIEAELAKLGVQSKSTAIRASERMRGKWFEGNMLVDTKKRNFDIGLDGYVTPTLVPGVQECERARAVSYPAPRPAVDKYGFSMELEIEPREWEKEEILKTVYLGAGAKKIYPEEHFPWIMERIKREAMEKGHDFDY